MKILPVTNYNLNHNLINSGIKQDKVFCAEDHNPWTFPNAELQQVYFCSRVNIDDEKSRLKHIIDDMWYPFDRDCVLFHSNKRFSDKKTQIVKSFLKYQKENNIPREEQDAAIAKYAETALITICKEAVKELNKMRADVLDKDIDPNLIFKFKTAIDSGNYDLRKVYREYYKPLEDIKTVEELQRQFPNMYIPENSRANIAKQLIATLDDDFYEVLGNYIKTNQNDKINEYAEEKFQSLYPLCEKFISKDYYNIILHDAFIREISLAYLNYETDGTKLPVMPKEKFNISKEEEALLTFDYDELITTLYKALYLEGYDLKSLTCESPVTKITPAQIKTPAYKFKQVPPYAIEKIFKISDKIIRGERDYDNFDEKQLRSRLEYFENSAISSDDKVLECILKFEYIQLLPEDYKILGDFLRELDNLKDGRQSVDEFLENVKTKDLTPKGQERLNKIEREKREKQIRERQKYEKELYEIRERHSNTVINLFANDMAESAQILQSYYPQKVDDETLSEFFKLINSYSDEKGNISDPEKLEEYILCLDKYNTAKSQNSPVLQIALKFADNDKIKAGQYLKNFENILNYPDDEIDYFDENIMQIVVNKCCSDNASSLSDPKKIQTMTEYLCRYENYNELSDDEQNTLSEFIKLFNENDEIDKAVMKYLVSEKYINNDTNLIFKNNSAEIPVIFAKEAKTEIFKHYKYPKCIDYLTAFEFAMTKTTSYNTGASGIKQLTPNSENRKLEVKIAFDKDRLYSSNNDYRFDIYDSYGYHD